MSKVQVVDLDAQEQEALHEFEHDPAGRHSPALQKIVNRMRGGSVNNKLVLFCTKPHKEWILARLNGRAKPITFYWDRKFTNLDEAEVEIYRMRLAEMKGADTVEAKD
ncbi:MAG: ABC transporter permease [Rhizobiaceae bacterium]|nr:ABC transporter permease [Rhizobiaceae bacterium]